MTKSNREQARQWRGRKNSQNPHGKVRSFEELAEDAGQDKKK